MRTVHRFSLLETYAPPHSRWPAFALGALSQGLWVCLLVLLGLIFPERIERSRQWAPVYIQLPNMTLLKKEVPRVKLPMPRLPVELAKLQVRIPAPRLIDPPATPVIAVDPPKVSISVPVVPQPPATTLAPKPGPSRSLPEVKTNVFAGSSEVATLKLPAREVQTGGFGSPNGFGGPVREDGNVVRMGSFGLPPGEGYGNGTGGTKGARGTVASAGFGNGIATGGSGRSPSGTGAAVARTDTFGVVPVAPTKVTRHEAVQSSTKPVEILFKPQPVYTAEARHLGLEGEVALSVVFQANGEVQVLGVMSSLGHGLDQAAVQAAKQIRFKPAQRDGQSVDFPATLRVVFQIAGGKGDLQ